MSPPPPYISPTLFWLLSVKEFSVDPPQILLLLTKSNSPLTILLLSHHRMYEVGHLCGGVFLPFCRTKEVKHHVRRDFSPPFPAPPSLGFRRRESTERKYFHKFVVATYFLVIYLCSTCECFLRQLKENIPWSVWARNLPEAALFRRMKRNPVKRWDQHTHTKRKQQIEDS